MFTRIGLFTVRRRRIVLFLSGAFVALSVVLGTQVFSNLNAGGYTDPSSESELAEIAVSEDFDFAQPNAVFLVDAHSADVDDPAVAADAEKVLSIVTADPNVDAAFSYWSLGSIPQLRSSDGSSGLILANISADTDTQILAAEERLEEAIAELDAQPDSAISVEAAGVVAANAAVTETIEGDLARAEAIAVPITLLLLLLVFGGLVAAGLPLLIGLMAVVGTLLTLLMISFATDVSIFSINLVTALGLGLAIDYSLFIVSRFREELAARPLSADAALDRGLVDAAVVRTVETAGRTVAFSALTVAVSLAALLVFPMYFLRSFAYAGVGVTLVAAAASLFTLTAVLGSVGRRIDSLSWRRVKTADDLNSENPMDGFWYRAAMFSQRHAVVVVIAVVSLLILLGLPFTKIAFGVPDERVLPEDDPARIATERLRSDYDTSEAEAFSVVLRGDVNAMSDFEIDEFASAASSVAGAARVDSPTGVFVDGEKVQPTNEMLETQRIESGVRISVVPDVEPISAEGEALASGIRELDSPAEETLVGGMSASFIDSKASIAERLPWALGLIALSTFILLFLMFGSVLVPLKAIVLNILSLSATFGAMVWVFQWGHGAGLLDFTATGLTDLSTPILMFCVAFGLSMDYEVFLLSRISEEYKKSGDNTESVAMGLQRTGKIVTAAAALLAVTFLAFSASSITFIKLFGLGLALAVVMDATVVRATLVPAFMQLAGNANWWAPAWMKAIHERFGLSESEPESPDAEIITVESPAPDTTRDDELSSV